MTGLALTGVTGAVGGAVAAELAAAGDALTILVRDPARAPDLPGADVRVVASYGDYSAVRDALDGANTLFLVSAKESADRLDQHRCAVDAAVAAGVRRIVYLSFLSAAPDATFTFARDHFHTEAHIRASGAAFTFLRSSLYADFVPGMVWDDGAIKGPAGDGAVAWVARADVAACAAAVLNHDGHEGRTYDLTGPRAWTMAETAALLGARYVPETLDEARASRAGYGAPAWEVEGWVTSYAAIATGEMDVVSDSVRRLTGREARSLEQVVGA
ncbi:NAD(P)-dependent oxidoreductase [Actinorhabdospora filicis]|uniref:NAD(P)-dependent oxidoreductase n=1 Tax=Actinorhabdospora filicis TaxID=1785913 RepID=A0A9W6SFL3_9ACTN|nr:NAD(P)H-binding protein [Actinorhabdospora filicis]GLZ76259.1 NAD(P)-dependent oxidoreductase [Actinorhabdospora filicis]